VELSPSFPAFLATVVVVTASGALAPGPLFAANLLQGARGGLKSGFMMSVGHTRIRLGAAFPKCQYRRSKRDFLAFFLGGLRIVR